MFVDSDDELPADSVDNLLSASKNTQYDLVIGGLFVSENGKKRLVSLNQESYNNFDLANEIVTYSNDGIAAFVMSSSCGKLYKNEIINNNNIIFNENLQAGEDGIFVAEYLYVSKKVFNVFLPSYIIHRMTPNERISATSSVYSDIFEFRCMYFQNLWEILRDNSSDTEQRYFMQMALQKLIGDLVIAGAYNDFYLRGELYAKMEKFLEIPFIREASLIYRRKRAADSVWIPLFLRYRQPRLLCIAMKIRGQAYIKARGKSRFVKSIYRIGK
ncbi:hypothetical protein FACS1894167_05400 [Synergistales bacterium]|nr:hypothetical protein FACS1894167_05400 [Synergistales bacterium]